MPTSIKRTEVLINREALVNFRFCGNSGTCTFLGVGVVDAGKYEQWNKQKAEVYLGSSSIFLVCCSESGTFLGVGGSFLGASFLSLDACSFSALRASSTADASSSVSMAVFVRTRLADRGRLDGFFWSTMFFSQINL